MRIHRPLRAMLACGALYRWPRARCKHSRRNRFDFRTSADALTETAAAGMLRRPTTTALILALGIVILVPALAIGWWVDTTLVK